MTDIKNFSKPKLTRHINANADIIAAFYSPVQIIPVVFFHKINAVISR